MPRLAQLVEHLTVVVKKHVSADIRVSPVQVRERGPTNWLNRRNVNLFTAQTNVMSTKAVNTSLSLILLMILSSLSYSVLNGKEEKLQFNDQTAMMTSTTASNYTPLVLQTQYFEQDENPGYIGTTYDDRIIVYSEAQDARGDFSNSISIYSLV